jgi:hypothetical protein
LSHFSAIYIAKTGFTADRNPFKADDWYKIDCSMIFEKPEELPLEPRPVANGGAKSNGHRSRAHPSPYGR